MSNFLIKFSKIKHNIIVKKDKLKLFLFLIFSVVIGIINGIFGGGGGMLCVPVLKWLLKLDDKTSHATTVLIMAIISVPTLVVYITTLHFDFISVIFVTIGVIIGGCIGSKLLKKLSNNTINLTFIILMFLASLKMIF